MRRRRAISGRLLPAFRFSKVLRSFARATRMFLFPRFELLAALGAKLLFARRQFGFRLRAATALFVLLLALDRLVAGPAAILFLGHQRPLLWDACRVFPASKFA